MWMYTGLASHWISLWTSLWTSLSCDTWGALEFYGRGVNWKDFFKNPSFKKKTTTDYFIYLYFLIMWSFLCLSMSDWPARTKNHPPPFVTNSLHSLSLPMCTSSFWNNASVFARSWKFQAILQFPENLSCLIRDFPITRISPMLHWPEDPKFVRTFCTTTS